MLTERFEKLKSKAPQSTISAKRKATNEINFH